MTKYTDFLIQVLGFLLENYPRGDNWKNLDFKGGGGGGMMVKDVTKFHKCHLGGWGMLECVCVRGFIQDFGFWEGGTPKFGVDVEGVYST